MRSVFVASAPANPINMPAAADDSPPRSTSVTICVRVASQIDATRFGVQALYVFGSVKNATAGPGSDLDLIVHFVGDERQRADLLLWLDGFSTALAEANYLRTGHRRDRLFDLHFVTDDDIARQTPIAAKIGAVTDPARPLALGAPLSADVAKP